MSPVYSAIAPPPCRGIIIIGFTRMLTKTEYCVDARRLPILGIVSRSGFENGESRDSDVDFLMVYHDCTLEEFDWSEGLRVFDPGYQNHVGFKVVWCMWEEKEDDERLAAWENKVKQAGEKLLDSWSRGNSQTRYKCARGFGDLS